VVDCSTSAPTRAGWRRHELLGDHPAERHADDVRAGDPLLRRTATASSAIVLVEKSAVAGSDSPTPRLSIVIVR
jgi:hypothetical protein